MGYKAIMYAANTATQTVPVGEQISFGEAIHKAGCGIRETGGNILLSGAGYYEGEVNISAAFGTGVGTVTLYANGVEIPGAVASATDAGGAIVQMAIPFVVKAYCGAPIVISAVIAGAAGTVNNAAIVAKRL